jgi:hypothetical protein
VLEGKKKLCLSLGLISRHFRQNIEGAAAGAAQTYAEIVLLSRIDGLGILRGVRIEQQ